jgi:hypothetical protein
MSDDPTRRFDEVKSTAPTLETILLRINAVAEELHSFRTEMTRKFDALEIRLDRIESDGAKNRSEMLAMRADFREFQGALRDALPSLVK